MVSAVEAGLAVIDPGHAATERPGMEALVAAVAGAAPGVVDLTGIDPAPWR
jgi:putative NIF3 family GTP cyclohydrolase 1 type 2